MRSCGLPPAAWASSSLSPTPCLSQDLHGARWGFSGGFLGWLSAVLTHIARPDSSGWQLQVLPMHHADHTLFSHSDGFFLVPRSSPPEKVSAGPACSSGKQGSTCRALPLAVHASALGSSAQFGGCFSQPCVVWSLCLQRPLDRSLLYVFWPCSSDIHFSISPA